MDPSILREEFLDSSSWATFNSERIVWSNAVFPADVLPATITKDPLGIEIESILSLNLKAF